MLNVLLRGSLEGKAQRGQYLLAGGVGLGLRSYIPGLLDVLFRNHMFYRLTNIFIMITLWDKESDY